MTALPILYQDEHRIEASTLTGRNHQIRRHLKHIFHPIIGDTIYGDGKQNEFFREKFNCRRSLLHAREFAFRHPVTNAGVRIVAPLDADFGAVLKALSWDDAGLSDTSRTSRHEPVHPGLIHF